MGDQAPAAIQRPLAMIPWGLSSHASVWSNTDTNNHIALGLFGFATLASTRGIFVILKCGCTGGTGPLGRRAPAVGWGGFRIPRICQNGLSISTSIEQGRGFGAAVATGGARAESGASLRLHVARGRGALNARH